MVYMTDTQAIFCEYTRLRNLVLFFRSSSNLGDEEEEDGDGDVSPVTETEGEKSPGNLSRSSSVASLENATLGAEDGTSSTPRDGAQVEVPDETSQETSADVPSTSSGKGKGTGKSSKHKGQSTHAPDLFSRNKVRRTKSPEPNSDRITSYQKATSIP